MPQVTHVEWPAGDADRLQSFLEGLFGWEFENVAPPGVVFLTFGEASASRIDSVSGVRVCGARALRAAPSRRP